MRNITIKIGGNVRKIVSKYFGSGLGVIDLGAIVIHGHIFTHFFFKR